MVWPSWLCRCRKSGKEPGLPAARCESTGTAAGRALAAKSKRMDFTARRACSGGRFRERLSACSTGQPWRPTLSRFRRCWRPAHCPMTTWLPRSWPDSWSQPKAKQCWVASGSSGLTGSPCCARSRSHPSTADTASPNGCATTWRRWPRRRGRYALSPHHLCCRVLRSA